MDAAGFHLIPQDEERAEQIEATALEQSETAAAARSIHRLSDMQAPALWRKATLVAGGLALFAAGCFASAATLKPMNTSNLAKLYYTFDDYDGPFVANYTLPPLPYAYDALDEYIDKETMMLHHDKHHNALVTNLNKALPDKKPALLELLEHAIDAEPAVRNNAGGVYNHDFFWKVLAPKGSGGTISSKLSAAINNTFGSFDDFKNKFYDAGLGRFGSGWAWLVVDCENQLNITSTANQDNPLMKGVDATEGIPILGVDVWEHAYYLKYRNRRGDYLKAFWNVVNWNAVNAWYEDALNGEAQAF